MEKIEIENVLYTIKNYRVILEKTSNPDRVVVSVEYYNGISWHDLSNDHHINIADTINIARQKRYWWQFWRKNLDSVVNEYICLIERLSSPDGLLETTIQQKIQELKYREEAIKELGAERLSQGYDVQNGNTSSSLVTSKY